MTGLIRTLRDGRRPRRRALLVPLAVLLGLAVAGLAVRAAARGDEDLAPRTVELVARNMTFYLAGQAEPNPRLIVARGERVRFVLRNDDPGMGHDLTLPTLNLGSRLLRDAGTETELVVRAPERTGEHPYVCSLHAASMRGVLEVR